MHKINISNIVDALLNPELYFNTLMDIKVEMDGRGMPIFYAGVNSVVFKVQKGGEMFAAKCYYRCDKDFIAGLKAVNNYFTNNEYSYINHSQIIENELIVYNLFGDKNELTIELSSWIDGVTLSEYIYMLKRGEKLDFEIGEVIEALLQFSLELLSAPFAHGDIKVENILLRKVNKYEIFDKSTDLANGRGEKVINKVINNVINNGVDSDLSVEKYKVINKFGKNREKRVEIVLIDFSDAYIENLSSTPIGEIGTYLYSHPLRDENYYNNRIDDYPLLIIIVTLLLIEHNLPLYSLYSGDEFPIFVPEEIIAGKSEMYREVAVLFGDDFILSRFVSLLESPLPSVKNLYRWVEIIKEWYCSSGLSGDVIFFSEKYSSYGIINSASSQIVVPAIFSDIFMDAKGRFCSEYNGKWGVISESGKILIDFKYELIAPFCFSRSLMKIGGKYGFFDEDFQIVIAPQFEEANSFACRYAVVKVCGKYGYINVDGEIVVEPIYDFAYNIREQGKVRVRFNGEIKVISI